MQQSRNLFAVAIVVLVCSAACAQRQQTSRYVSPSSTFVLSPDAMTSAKIKADNGDILSMKIIADHYGVGLSNLEQSIHWYKKAGDAGDRESQEYVLCYYAGTRDGGNLQQAERRWGIPSPCLLRSWAPKN